MTAPTFGVCHCDHGEHAHELKRDNRTRTHCTLYHCPCKQYDERERYSLRLVPQPAAGYDVVGAMRAAAGVLVHSSCPHCGASLTKIEETT